MKEQYRQASGGVTERTRQLAEVTEELERIKQEMEERGSSMTDGCKLNFLFVNFCYRFEDASKVHVVECLSV